MSKQIFIVKLWNIISFMYIIITKYNCKSDYIEGGIMKNRIGQLFIVGFPGKEITPELKNLIHEYNIGGVILFAYNIGTPKEVLELTTALQKKLKQQDINIHYLLQLMKKTVRLNVWVKEQENIQEQWLSRQQKIQNMPMR